MQQFMSVVVLFVSDKHLLV